MPKGGGGDGRRVSGLEGTRRGGGTKPLKDTAPEKGATDKGMPHTRTHNRRADDAHTRGRYTDRNSTLGHGCKFWAKASPGG